MYISPTEAALAGAAVTALASAGAAWIVQRAARRPAHTVRAYTIRQSLNFAQANNMNFLSIWAIQRDNSGCPGTRDSNTCSGIAQNTWDFSHLLESFTG